MNVLNGESGFRSITCPNINISNIYNRFNYLELPGFLFGAWVNTNGIVPYQAKASDEIEFSVSRVGTGIYEIKHNLNHNNYTVMTTKQYDGNNNKTGVVEFWTDNRFRVLGARTDATSVSDFPFNFVVMGYPKQETITLPTSQGLSDNAFTGELSIDNLAEIRYINVSNNLFIRNNGLFKAPVAICGHVNSSGTLLSSYDPMGISLNTQRVSTGKYLITFNTYNKKFVSSESWVPIAQTTWNGISDRNVVLERVSSNSFHAITVSTVRANTWIDAPFTFTLCMGLDILPQ